MWCLDGFRYVRITGQDGYVMAIFGKRGSEICDPFPDSAAAKRAVDICERNVSPVRPDAINELLAMVG